MSLAIPATLDERIAWRLDHLRQQRASIVSALAALDQSIAELEALTDPSRYQINEPETRAGQPTETNADA